MLSLPIILDRIEWKRLNHKNWLWKTIQAKPLLNDLTGDPRYNINLATGGKQQVQILHYVNPLQGTGWSPYAIPIAMLAASTDVSATSEPVADKTCLPSVLPATYGNWFARADIYYKGMQLSGETNQQPVKSLRPVQVIIRKCQQRHQQNNGRTTHPAYPKNDSNHL